MDEKTEEKPKAKPAPTKKKRRIGRFVLRFFAFICIGTLFTILAALVYLDIFVSSKDIQMLVINLVENNTNGRLSITQTEYKLSRGVKFSGLVLYPTKTGTQPLLTLESVTIDYSLSNLWRARFILNAALLKDPHFYLENRDGVFNFAALFPPATAASTEPVKEVMPFDPNGPKELLPLHPRKIFLPFALLLKNIGIENLSVEYAQIVSKDSSKNQKIEASGIDIGLGLDWGFFNSTIEATFKSSGDKGTDLTLNKDGTTFLHLTDQFSCKLTLQNLMNLELKFDNEIQEFKQGKTQLIKIPLHFLLRTGLKNSLDGFDIQEISLDFAEFLRYRASGQIAFPTARKDLVDINFKQNASIDFDQANKLITPFIPTLSTAGQIIIEKIDLDGRLDAASIADIANILIPNVSAAIILQKLSLHESKAKITAPDLNGKFSLALAKTKDKNLYVSLDSQASMGDLLTFESKLNCDTSCSKINGNTKVELPSLRKLFAFAAPIASTLGQGAMLPTKVEGALKILAEVHAVLPPKLDLQNLVQKGQVDYEAHLDLKDFALRHHLFKLDLAAFNTEHALKGNLAEQHASVIYSLKKVSAEAPGKEPLPVSAENFSFKINIDNHIDAALRSMEPFDATKIPLLCTTKIATTVDLARSAVAGTLNQELRKFSFKANLSQENARELKLDDLLLELKSIGLKVTSHAGLRNKENFLVKPLPDQVDAAFSLALQQSSKSKLPFGIKNTGRFAVNVTLASSDLKAFDVTGNLALDHFGLEVLNKDGATLITMQDADGRLPFKQRIEPAKFTKPQADPIASAIPSPKGESVIPSPKGVGDPIENQAKNAPPKLANLDEALRKYQARTNTPFSGNAMTLSDYTVVRPFFPGKHPIRIRSIEGFNLSVDNIEFDMDIRQNWLLLNEFGMGFLGGKIQGSTQLGFELLPRYFKSTWHVTQLNTRKLLDKFPKLQRDSKSFSFSDRDPNIDASVHFIFDIENNDMTGGIEISQIGKEQLKMILYYIDPDKKDPTIGKILFALNVGSLRSVVIPIRNGEIGIDISMDLLGVPLPVPKISRFPIGKIVANITGSSRSQNKTVE